MDRSRHNGLQVIALAFVAVVVAAGVLGAAFGAVFPAQTGIDVWTTLPFGTMEITPVTIGVYVSSVVAVVFGTLIGIVLLFSRLEPATGE